MLEYGAIAAFIGIVVIWFVTKSKPLGGKEGDFEYVKAGDTEGQISYDVVKNPKKQRISAKDLLELSWQFLYDITETVLNKFAVRTRKEVHECGKTMVNHGMKYMHTVEYNPEITTTHTKAIEESRKDEPAIQR